MVGRTVGTGANQAKLSVKAAFKLVGRLALAHACQDFGHRRLLFERRGELALQFVNRLAFRYVRLRRHSPPASPYSLDNHSYRIALGLGQVDEVIE